MKYCFNNRKVVIFITSVTVNRNVPEMMGKIVNDLLKSKTLINDYYNKGYIIKVDNNDCHLIIKYKRKKYDVSIIKNTDDYYWFLEPYNNSYFTTKLSSINSFEMVMLAIKEDVELYTK